MKKILFMAGLVSTMLLAACSSEENVVKEDGKVNVAKGITFQFTEEEYVPGVVGEEKAGAKGTRAVQSETVDLGNGLVAELSLEPDTMSTAKTRAPKPMSDGHYTIYAVDASNVRHDGIKGTITSGVFTPDALGEWNLNPGETYTFVCFNDAITDNGTNLRYTYATPGGIDENAMIGVTTHTVSTTAHDVVSFTMRHQNARLRYQVTTYTAPITSPTFEIVWTDPYGRDKAIRDYDLLGNETTSSYNYCHLTNLPLAITPDRAISYSPYVETYKATTTRYLYVPGGSRRMDGLNLKITGTLYGKALNVEQYFSDAAAGTQSKYQKNHSYVFNVKLKSKDALYLYQDGTVGYLGNKGTRTPIGVVAREKTATQDGMAAGLDIIKNGWTAYKWEDVSVTGHGNIQLNTTVYNGLWDGQNDMNGYNWTWDANSTKDHVVRAEEQAKYPAFYMAGHYQPSVAVTGTNVGKWYIPAMGEVVQLFKRFGPVTISATESFGGYFHTSNADMNKVIKAFTDINSNTHLNSYFLWTSTTGDASYNYWPVSFFTRGNGVDGAWTPTFVKHGANLYILPFVKF